MTEAVQIPTNYYTSNFNDVVPNAYVRLYQGQTHRTGTVLAVNNGQWQWREDNSTTVETITPESFIYAIWYYNKDSWIYAGMFDDRLILGTASNVSTAVTETSSLKNVKIVVFLGVVAAAVYFM